MASNFERYAKDIQRLAKRGLDIAKAMQKETSEPKNKTVKAEKTATEEERRIYPRAVYQSWYSEALAIIRQLLPDRVHDFEAYYKPASNRKEINYSTYTISDYLKGTRITRLDEEIVGPGAALHLMYQQALMVSGLTDRFESTLYDIRTLVHADLLDDELHAAEELNKKGFQRGAGAIAGVVLEGHLAAVCERNKVVLRKKDPSISDLNDALKNASTTETATWRFIQHLGDLRNKCDHKKSAEPTNAEVAELIDGVRKITKTVL